MAAGSGCEYINQHGVKCGRPLHHFGSHATVDRLVPPDPFCLQYWDPFTLACIRAWISAAHAHRVSEAKIQRAEQHFKDISDWQREHGTKVPD